MNPAHIQIQNIIPKQDWTLQVVFVDGTEGIFDVNPYLEYEAFEHLKDIDQFLKIHNGGYFIEWECGADLSSDTLRARLKTDKTVPSPKVK